MQLREIYDPRDALERLNRDELWEYARKMGVKEIDNSMYEGGYAAERMRKILRAKGLTNPPVRLRILGQPYGAVGGENSREPASKAMTLDELVASKPEPVPPSVDPSWAAGLPMGKLKAYAKAHGIKQSRTDTRETLLAKING